MKIRLFKTGKFMHGFDKIGMDCPTGCWKYGKPLILTVDWNAIVAYGTPQTNHRILPGNRIFVEAATQETVVTKPLPYGVIPHR